MSSTHLTLTKPGTLNLYSKNHGTLLLLHLQFPKICFFSSENNNTSHI